MNIDYYGLSYKIMEIILVIANAASTIFMIGVIWVMQLVHYPLFSYITTDRFSEFQKLHSKHISFIVILPMLIELLSAGLLIKFHPASVPSYYFVTGFVLVMVIWCSTFLLQAKYHSQLSNGFDCYVHVNLMNTNWIRTLCWTARGIIVLYIMASSFTSLQMS